MLVPVRRKRAASAARRPPRRTDRPHPRHRLRLQPGARTIARKFQDWPLPLRIPVLCAKLADFDVVYSAHFTRYGAIPATLHPCPGAATDVAVQWLTPAEFERMDATEGIGINYDRHHLTGIDLEIEGFGTIHTANLFEPPRPPDPPEHSRQPHRHPLRRPRLARPGSTRRAGPDPPPAGSRRHAGRFHPHHRHRRKSRPADRTPGKTGLAPIPCR